MNEQFDAFVNEPENSDKLLEFVGGEIVQVPNNAYVSYIAARILTMLMNFVLAKKQGYVTAEGGGYMIGGDRYAPNVAFISFEKQPELARQG